MTITAECPWETELPQRSIHIGGVFASRTPAVVRTVLGSCVAACLYDGRLGIGGMNHFLLPDGYETRGAGASRFGVHAMELLINELMKLGADRRRLQAKVFGGAHVLAIAASDSNPGPRNCRFVRDFLSAEGIPITSELLGGQRPLSVYFYTAEGRVMLKRLGAPDAMKVAKQERSYEQELRQAATARAEDDVTLF